MENIVSSEKDKQEERSLSVHKEHEVLLKFEKAGLNDVLAQKVIDSKDNTLALKVIECIRNNGYTPTTSQKRVREIMGENYLGLDMVTQKFGVTYTDEQVKMLNEVPFSENILEACKKTHILVAGFPITILEIRKKAPRGTFYRCEDAWYNNQNFTQNERVLCQWHLIQKEDVKNSRNKSWKDQLTLLSEDDKVPTASAVVYTVVLYYLVTGKKLFTNYFVRTASVASDGGPRVYIGFFDSDGLRVDSLWGEAWNASLGVAVAQKFKK